MSILSRVGPMPISRELVSRPAPRPTSRGVRLRRAALVLLALCGTACSTESPAGGPCDDIARVAILPAVLDEASGVALSRTHAGVLWAHNDSEGTPSLYAIDVRGRLLAEIEVPGAVTQSDWEDIAPGPCPAGECLFIGDIGDNLHGRQDRAILRLPEPEPASGSAGPVERFPIAYPDGPRDAEALFVLPDTTVYIVSKGRNGPVTVFRYPPPLRSDERVLVDPVQQLTPGLVQLSDLVTGASATPDGRMVAIRTYTHVQLYTWAGDTLVAVWPGAGQDLGLLAEPQGEGIALSVDGTVYLVSETGLERRPPPLSRLRCLLP